MAKLKMTVAAQQILPLKSPIFIALIWTPAQFEAKTPEIPPLKVCYK